MNIVYGLKSYAEVTRRSLLQKLYLYQNYLVLVLFFGLFVITRFQPQVIAVGCPGTTSITSNTSWATNQCLGDVTVSNGATLTIAGNTTHDLVSLTLGDGATNGFIVAQGDSGSGNGVTINTDSDIYIYSSSAINGDGQGYAAQMGTGGSSTGGGSHAGQGYSGSGVTYGSITAPVALGSGGRGSAGGGAIRLNIIGNLTNNGIISADGPTLCSFPGGNGTGSGGSIWVDFTGGSSSISGSGVIRTNGGYAYGGGCGTAQPGSGGRIAITGYTANTYTGSLQSFSSGSNNVGAAGTIFTQSSVDVNGHLTIDNNNWTVYGGLRTPLTTAEMTAFDSYTFKNRGTIGVLPAGSVTASASQAYTVSSNALMYLESGDDFVIDSGASFTIDGGGTLTIASGASTAVNAGGSFNHDATGQIINNGTLDVSAISYSIGGTLTTHQNATNTLNNVTVLSGGNITHPANGSVETYKLDLSINNLTVDSGGLISVDGRGFAAQQGPGGAVAGGGSHAGQGYAGNNVIYGNITGPETLGSGGRGSAGGGAVKLTIAGDFINNGTLSADGPSLCSFPGGNGTGSGGSVWIDFTGGSSAWSGAGTIRANGGYAYGSGCGTGLPGSGGRVAVTGYVSDTHSGPQQSYSSGSNNRATAGTIHLRSTSDTSGHLIVDNNGNTVTGSLTTPLTTTELTAFDSYTFSNRATVSVLPDGNVTAASSQDYTVNSNAIFTLSSADSLTLNSGSSLTLAAATMNVDSGAALTFNSGSTFNHNTSGQLVNNGFFDISALTYTVAGTLTTHQNATNNLTDVIVSSGGNITHPANGATAVYRLDLDIDDLTINSGGAISVANRGFSAGQGPGGSATASGSHAGQVLNGSTVYGNITAPTTLGSGSKNNAGGGSLKLNISGNFTNNGTVSASDDNDVCSTNGHSAAGGSVWIDFVAGGTFSGSGLVESDGGYVYGGGCADGAGSVGSGGRISITEYSSSTFSGILRAHSPGSINSGSAGTIFTKSLSDASGHLRVDNNNVIPSGSLTTPLTTTELTAFDSYTFSNRATVSVLPDGNVTAASSQDYTVNSNAIFTLSSADSLTLNSGSSLTLAAATMNVDSGAALTFNSGSTFNHNTSGQLVNNGFFDISALTYTVAGTLTTHQNATNNLTDVIVSSGGNITHPANGATAVYRLDLDIDDLTINSGGAISVANRGFSAGQGPGGSATQGGGHAGYAGQGNFTTYGSVKSPTTLGSGSKDAVGGGAVQLNLTGNFVNNGSINAGGSQLCGTNRHSAAAGSIWVNLVSAGSVSGSGSLLANPGQVLGGFCANGAGSTGSGGRIALTGYSANTLSGLVQAGSVGSINNGAAGTIFTQSNSDANGHLVIDNNNASTATNVYTVVNESLSLDSLLLRNRARLLVASGNTLSVLSGTATVNSNTSLEITGNVTTTGSVFNLSGPVNINNTSQQLWGSVSINSGGILSHSTNSASKTSYINVEAQTLTVNSGGIIEANGRGYSGGGAGISGGGSGAGLLGGAVSSGGGASYGGLGDDGAGPNPGLSGAIYGQANNPQNLGSGGGGGNTAAGGAGGGQINLNVLGAFTNNGIIRANGSDASSGTHGGGGGSGGSIRIASADYDCTSGSLSAIGGNGAGSTTVGGNGGGGRVALYATGIYIPCSTNQVGNGTLYIYPGAPATPINLNAASQTATSITWQWVDNSNSEDGFYLYDASDDSLIGNITSTTTAGTGTTYTYAQTGLEVDTVYSVYVSAYNFYEEGTQSSTLATSTLMVTPSAPTLLNPTVSTLQVRLNQSNKPLDVKYYVRESSTSLYVQTSGSLAGAQTKQTYTQWGGANGTKVINLQANTRYTFGVFVDGVGGPTASLYTLAATPSTPQATEIKPTSITLSVNQGSNNPSTTLLALYDTVSNRYVQNDNFLGTNPVWKSAEQWNEAKKTIKGLAPKTLYSLVVLARNGDGVVTSPSSDLNILTPPPKVEPPTVVKLDDNTVRLKLNQSEESEDVAYSIIEENSEKYLTLDGNFSDAQVAGTFIEWGGEDGFILNELQPGVDYSFVVESVGESSTPATISIPAEPVDETSPSEETGDSTTGSESNEFSDSDSDAVIYSGGLLNILSRDSFNSNRVSRFVVTQWERMPDIIAATLPWILILMLAIIAIRFYFQAKDELRHSKKTKELTVRIEKLSKQKETLLGLTSHYLRTPITIIKSSIEMAPSVLATVNISNLQTIANQLATAVEDILKNTSTVVNQESLASPSIAKDAKLIRPATVVPFSIMLFILFLMNVLIINGRQISQPLLYVLAQILGIILITQFLGSSYRKRALRERENVRLEKLLAEQESVNKAKSEFISNSSDKLFGLYTQLALAMKPVVDANKPISKIAKNGVTQLEEVVTKLKRADLLQNKLHTIEFKQASLEGLLKEASQSTGADFSDTTLLTNGPQHVVLTDKDLAQIVMNSVVNNAGKFSPENAKIDYKVVESGNSVSVDVIDHGNGIPAHIIDSLFTPFTRGSDIEDFTYEGFGMDLYIDKMAMNYMNGDITINSMDGKGTQVSLKFVKAKN